MGIPEASGRGELAKEDTREPEHTKKTNDQRCCRLVSVRIMPNKFVGAATGVCLLPWIGCNPATRGACSMR